MSHVVPVCLQVVELRVKQPSGVQYGPPQPQDLNPLFHAREVMEETSTHGFLVLPVVQR